MKKIAIILRRAPYGDINAAEAVRHALGAVSEEISVSLLLVDYGVLLLKKDQDAGETGFTELGSVLKDCIEMGVAVYADRGSLAEERILPEEMAEGVRTVNGSEISEMIKDADSVMIY